MEKRDKFVIIEVQIIEQCITGFFERFRRNQKFAIEEGNCFSFLDIDPVDFHAANGGSDLS